MSIFSKFTAEGSFKGLGSSPAANAAKGVMCETTQCQALAGGAIGAAGAVGNLFNHISDSKDFCLNPGQAAGNTAFQFLKNGLNMAGGLGDLIMGGIHNPLGDMQNKLTKLNQQYEQNFKQYTQAFASAQVSLDEEIVNALPIMNDANSKNNQFYYETLKEQEQLDRIYIIFIFVYIVIIIIYLFIK